MSIEIILASLEGVKQTTPTQWSAKCPSHEDENNSLSLKFTEEGRTLIHCHAGCKTMEVMDAIHLPMKALFPPLEKTSATFIAPSITLLKNVKETLSVACLLNQTIAMYQSSDVDEQKVREICSQSMATLSNVEQNVGALIDHQRDHQRRKLV
jgi:hypothetical protein